MASHPEGPQDWENRDDSNDNGDPPLHGQVRHSNLSARVPDDVGPGVFSNGVMILSGSFEVVLDFVLRMGEQQRVASRVVLPHVVARQLVQALTDNIRNYENRFGHLSGLPKPLSESKSSEKEASPQSPDSESQETPPSPSGVPGESPPPAPVSSVHPENLPETPKAPKIEDIYDELKLPDAMLSGRYANAVLIRHSGAEFCFDFITNVYPRSAVSARVFLAAPHIPSFLQSLKRSVMPSGEGESPSA